ncbi:recombinase family protein [Liquorilactobacillus sp.]|uniref:recombinase family protein n=1 Tax=Liquorilactobacillus sp. TaxID=2767923 RepID=UPI0039E9DC07
MIINELVGKKVKRAVGYVRVSTAEQADEGFSIAAQGELIRQECSRYGSELQFVRLYADEGISGKSIKRRPQMQQLLADVQAGEIDAVICWNISRIARNVANLLEIVDIFESNDVSFISINEKMDTQTPAGRLMLQIMASMGEYERNNIAENVYMGSRRRAVEGWNNSGLVLGYDNVTDKDGNHTLQINSDEASIIKHIFDLAALGKGLRAIANELNKMGVCTKRGNSFSTAAVKVILTNPLYVGKVRYGQYRHWEKKRRHGKQSDYVLVDGHHTAIIDPQQWARVVSLMKQRHKLPAWTRQGSNVLTGLLRCPECGGPMAASNTTNSLADGKRKRIRYYSCANFRNKGTTVCHANSIRAEVAEQLVQEKLLRTLSLPKIGQQVIKQMKNSRRERCQNLKRQQLSNQAEQTRLEKSVQEYEQLMADNPELQAAIRPRMEVLENQLDQLHADDQQVAKQLAQVDQLPKPKSIQDLLALVAKLIKQAEKETLKQLYQAFIQQITFDRRQKLVWITVAFDDDVIQQLETQSKAVELDKGSTAFSSPTFTFTF